MWARFCGTAFRRGFQMMSDVGQRQRGVCLCGETGPMARPRRGGVRHRDCGRVRRRTVPVLNGSAVRLYLSVLVREKDRAMRRQTGTRRGPDVHVVRGRIISLQHRLGPRTAGPTACPRLPRVHAQRSERGAWRSRAFHVDFQDPPYTSHPSSMIHLIRSSVPRKPTNQLTSRLSTHTPHFQRNTHKNSTSKNFCNFRPAQKKHPAPGSPRSSTCVPRRYRSIHGLM